MRGVLPFVALWIVGVLLVVVGTLGMTPGTDVIGVAGLGALALGTAFLSALIPSIKIINVAKPKKPERLTKKIIMAEPVPQEGIEKPEK